MENGLTDEIAPLAGLQPGIVEELLAGLEGRELVYREVPAIWQIRKKGVSASLRSWSILKKLSFPEWLEEHCRQIGSDHHHIARLWPAWLRAAWPAVEIWSGWSEVRIPESSVIPDALAWGRIQGYETLFWLDVGDEHKSSGKIADITARRLSQARRGMLQERDATGVCAADQELGSPGGGLCLCGIAGGCGGCTWELEEIWRDAGRGVGQGECLEVTDIEINGSGNDGQGGN